MGLGDLTLIVWNGMIQYFNTMNFVYFCILSGSYDVLSIVEANQFQDWAYIANLYFIA